MSQVLGDRWADVPKDVTEYERKVADLASRFQSVESEELRSILDQAGGMCRNCTAPRLHAPGADSRPFLRHTLNQIRGVGAEGLSESHY